MRFDPEFRPLAGTQQRYRVKEADLHQLGFTPVSSAQFLSRRAFGPIPLPWEQFWCSGGWKNESEVSLSGFARAANDGSRPTRRSELSILYDH